MSTATVPPPGPAAAPAPAPDLLRTTLRIDSWSTAAFGVFLLAGAKWLSGPLGLPVAWAVPFGIAMLGGAAALALIAGYPRIPARLAAAVVVGNTLSCAALVVLPFTDVIPLTAAGTAFLLVGALVVAVFAEAEFVGYRRSTRYPASSMSMSR
ncbi:hypothetical protein [Streptomyces sp. BPTC-684]|uniref:hypothetical protein n=1 Tax=Streptomyces sp. BPTC-684 TaxID=3043734 RepID=UPI0024B0864B|nr:hypothetical protein [Streptomyces sp. BPTC-684]WHM41017.1 hypothetical protein QIY60_31900 [Streptomyces sp. BPTC-684]